MCDWTLEHMEWTPIPPEVHQDIIYPKRDLFAPSLHPTFAITKESRDRMATTSQITKSHISWFTMLTTQDVITLEMLDQEYVGAGTEDDPYMVVFLKEDPRDPMGFPLRLRWTMCFAAGYSTFSVAFISSAFSGSIRDIAQDLHAGPESVTLGLSLFLLGFVFGPMLWAPCSGLLLFFLNYVSVL